MKYWLMKSEPDVFGIDDLKKARKKTEPWDGVRNYQARNFMRDEMSVGDGVLFYHSNTKVPGVAGLAEVASDAYPDPTQFDKKSKYFDPKSDPEDPRWFLVNIKYVRHLERVVSLTELRDAADKLGDFRLIRRGNRLSILPVSARQWKTIVAMAKRKPPA